MSVILYLPGLLVVLVKRHGVVTTARYIVMLVATQALIAWPFISQYPTEYFHNGFDFSRVFLYKWTVNWRFFPEDRFLSPELSKALLVGHLSTLVAFGALKWCRQDGGVVAVVSRALRRPALPATLGVVTADCRCSA